ncbi:hypothetical protein [Thermococcus sp. EP1]|nr:hypothetical protein [Thermococcus sp. EP1]
MPIPFIEKRKEFLRDVEGLKDPLNLEMAIVLIFGVIAIVFVLLVLSHVF